MTIQKTAPLKIVTVVGARPQFIKAAALRAVIDSATDVNEVLVHSGQHYDENMSGVFFDELGMRPPEYRLAVKGRSHGAMTGQMLEQLEAILISEKPDATLVYGDTNSTLAGALAASKLHIPIIHVEAGLRSFNRAMPEETNRVLTDHLSSLLFCSTEASVRNLAREGIESGVHMVGDIMYDVAITHGARADQTTLKQRFADGDRPLALLTLHRAENFGDPVRAARVLDFVARQADTHAIVFPIHPGTQAKLSALGLTIPPGVRVVEPLPYTELQGLISIADMVLTDSGGLQKEAYFHRTPCITLRDETEWVETIQAGWNALWSDPVHGPRREIADYGNGNTAERVLEIIRRELPTILAGCS